MLQIFIGYDSRIPMQYGVCKRSMEMHSSQPLSIKKLHRYTLEELGLFNRPFFFEDGQFVDQGDRKPFSTQFSFTRFLVPMLTQRQGLALYCDSDFFWREDIKGLEELADPSKAVMVVKHQYAPTDSFKMDGRIQSNYHRKNWSSLMLFNTEHPANTRLNFEKVSSQTGQWLHGFGWLEDHEIGQLPEEWNWLEGHSSVKISPSAVHYTRGTPDMVENRLLPFAEEWWAAYQSLK